MGQPAQRLRLGKIGYLNVLPIYFPLETGIIAHQFEIVSGTPAFLNRLMSQGSLELSVVSSIEYARNPERYLILPDLSISCHGPVGSVLLLSRMPFEDLADRTILATIQSHTSVALLRILLGHYCGYSPQIRLGNCSEALAAEPLPDALLCIGDEALQLRHDARFPHRLDLGAAWYDWTGLPFVFALWVMQRNALDCWNGHLAAASAALLAAKQWGCRHLDLVCDQAQQRKLLDRQELLEYYRGLDFDLGRRELDGLQSFFGLLKAMGEIAAIPDLEVSSEPAIDNGGMGNERQNLETEAVHDQRRRANRDTSAGPWRQLRPDCRSDPDGAHHRDGGGGGGRCAGPAQRHAPSS